MTLARNLAAAAFLGAALPLAVPATSAGAAEKAQLTSLDWPPYNGEKLPGGGSNTAKLRTLLKEAGYSLKTAFLPWKRAVKYGLENDEYLGYFPEYYTDNRDCLWSEQYDKSIVGFVEHASNTLNWSKVSDLKDYRIGVVAGYANDNGPFDAAMEAGELNVEPVNDDLTNLKKVAGGRIDAAVIDKKVMQHLLDKELPGAKDKVQFDAATLTTNGLYVCFQPNHPKAKEVRDKLNAAISGE